MAFCANSLAQTAHQATFESDLRTELNAPLASSLSQYYQPPALLQIQLLKQQQEQLQSPQTLAQLLGIYQAQLNQQRPQQVQPQPVQQTQINPFLYPGQFISSDTGEQARASQYSNNQQSLRPQQQNQPKRKSDDQNTQNQEKNSYVLYRPSSEESHEYVDLAPPAISQEEPNYYAMLNKPRKQKKYVEEIVTDKKLKARKDTIKLKHQIKRNEPELIQNNNDEHNEHDLLTESTDYVEQSEPTSRLDFQMHGN